MISTPHRQTATLLSIAKPGFQPFGKVLVVGSGTAVVIPDTVCDVAEADLSLAASGAYSADRSTEVLVELAQPMTADDVASYCAPLAACPGAEEGRSQFVWRVNEPGTSFAGPFPIAAGVAVELTSSIFVSFASAHGHSPGARFVVTGTAPMAAVTPGRSAFMTARGSAATGAAFYRVQITDGTVQPNLFRVGFALDHVPSDAELFGASLLPIDPHGNYAPGPDGLQQWNANSNLTQPPQPGNGVSLVFSSVAAFATGTEWVVFAATGGAVTTVAEPDAPLIAETSASTATPGNYTITMRSAGTRGVGGAPATFDYAVHFEGEPFPETSIAPIAVGDWWVGNRVSQHGLVLRFFTAYGHRVGAAWTIQVDETGAATVTAQPFQRLRVVASGATVTSRFWVRIKAAAVGGGPDVFELSDGGPYQGDYLVQPALSVAGNTEEGNGLVLRFATNDGSGFAPGQLWEVRTDAPGVQITTRPSIREFAMCSNRGVCDTSARQCTCFDGFMGVDCSIAMGVQTLADNLPGLAIFVDNLLYTSAVLQLETTKAPSEDFYFIQAIADGTQLFGVRGDGQVAVQLFSVDTMTVANGVTIEDGGLNVMRRGITITSGGLDVLDDGAQIAQTLDAEGLRVRVSTRFSRCLRRLWQRPRTPAALRAPRRPRLNAFPSVRRAPFPSLQVACRL